MIHRRQLGAVGTGGTLQLCLCRCGAGAPLARSRGFRSGWPCPGSACSTVIAYAIARSAIDYIRSVYVSNHRFIHIIHGAVVKERTVVPISSGVMIAVRRLSGINLLVTRDSGVMALIGG